MFDATKILNVRKSCYRRHMQQDQAKRDANAIAEAANVLTNLLSKALAAGAPTKDSTDNNGEPIGGFLEPLLNNVQMFLGGKPIPTLGLDTSGGLDDGKSRTG
jgi:hypothetical protein